MKTRIALLALTLATLVACKDEASNSARQETPPPTGPVVRWDVDSTYTVPDSATAVTPTLRPERPVSIERFLLTPYLLIDSDVLWAEFWTITSKGTPVPKAPDFAKTAVLAVHAPADQQPPAIDVYAHNGNTRALIAAGVITRSPEANTTLFLYEIPLQGGPLVQPKFKTIQKLSPT